MSFGAPLWFIALLVVPGIVAAYVVHERRAGARSRALISAPLLAAVAPRRPRWRRHVPVALQVLAVTGLIVALAKPQTTRAVTVEQATVVVVTDRSGSMLATDVAPNRLVAARNAAQTFVDATPDTLRLGAIAFNQRATVLANPTRDHDAVRAALGTIRAAGSTATGDAITSALEMIQRAGSQETEIDPFTGLRRETVKAPPSAIVLLSDGKSVRGGSLTEAAEKAKELKIPVYTVALGTQSGTITGSDGQVRDVPPDVQAMRDVAQTTGGEAFAISDAQELDRVYESLGSKLAKEDRKQEVSSTFAGTALLLILLGALASIRWFGRVI
ncbi:VWA domain-containing protein [Conexibacter sp. W3-3-2]|uniref:VWA domain-containing protein n=1 Tax=Conexibacter sp. W3-3-2 TaxID=2675227 RepID=UPI0012B971AB|nr:VWA domain-containing protein [Conexibacter sp. W3-3-2]MTD46060.1 VWA domain-containing protein [Conexibacter sp. W3-3-2]